MQQLTRQELVLGACDFKFTVPPLLICVEPVAHSSVHAAPPVLQCNKENVAFLLPHCAHEALSLMTLQAVPETPTISLHEGTGSNGRGESV